MVKLAIFDLVGTLFSDPSQLYPGAKDVLQFCRDKGIKIVAVSSATYDTSELEGSGLYEYLDSYRFLSRGQKKTPELFQEVMDEYGVSASETIGIGDGLYREIQCLNELDVTTIWVEHAYNATTDETVKPDYTIHTITECIDIFKHIV